MIRPQALLCILTLLLPRGTHAQTAMLDTPGLSVALRTAEVLVARADAIAAIWPGFWNPVPTFAILPDAGDLLLIHPSDGDACGGHPIADSLLPGALRGRAALVSRPATDSRFVVSELTIGSCTVLPLPVMGTIATYRSSGTHAGWDDDSLASQVMFVVHELFHEHQMRAFQSRPGSIGPFPDGGSLALNSALLESDPFHAKLADERAAILAAIQAVTEADRRAALHAYSALRSARLAAMPSDLRQFEENQERLEGVANWVGYEAVSRVVTHRPDDARDAIIADLASEWLDASGQPYVGVPRYWRWHLYLVATAKAFLLDRFGPADWKESVTNGATLQDLLLPGGSGIGALGTRQCVVTRADVVRSGNFTAGPFRGYNHLWKLGYGKLWWRPDQMPSPAPPLVMQAVRLDEAAEPRIYESTDIAQSGSSDDLVGAGPAFYPTDFRLPSLGRWMLVVTAGDNWGCFIHTVE